MSDDWEKARSEFVKAQVQYRDAERALARATAVLNAAERVCNRLFQERMRSGEATANDPERVRCDR